MKTLPSFTGDGSIRTDLATAKPLHLPFNVIIDEAMARVEQDELEQLYEKNASAELYGVPVHSIIEALDNPKPDFSEINELVRYCHNKSTIAGWWPTRLEPPANIPEKLCLIHSEVSEAMEGFRKDIMDDHLPHRKMAEVELADAIIRIADLAGYCGYDLAGAIAEKLDYNSRRSDHKIENRAKAGGKKF